MSGWRFNYSDYGISDSISSLNIQCAGFYTSIYLSVTSILHNIMSILSSLFCDIKPYLFLTVDYGEVEVFCSCVIPSLDEKCQLPNCNPPRASVHGRLHQFCSRKHYYEALCGLPGCNEIREANKRGGMYQFCSKEHYYEALCGLPGCNELRNFDKSGRLHQFCSYEHFMCSHQYEHYGSHGNFAHNTTASFYAHGKLFFCCQFIPVRKDYHIIKIIIINN